MAQATSGGVPSANIRERRLCQLVACSNAWASCSTTVSPPGAPLICRPMGKPVVVNPHGIEIEGKPLMLNGAVLRRSGGPGNLRRIVGPGLGDRPGRDWRCWRHQPVHGRKHFSDVVTQLDKLTTGLDVGNRCHLAGGAESLSSKRLVQLRSLRQRFGVIGVRFGVRHRPQRRGFGSKGRAVTGYCHLLTGRLLDIVPGDCLKHHGRIGDRTSHGSNVVPGPGKGDRAAGADQAIRRLETNDATAGCRTSTCAPARTSPAVGQRTRPAARVPTCGTNTRRSTPVSDGAGRSPPGIPRSRATASPSATCAPASVFSSWPILRCRGSANFRRRSRRASSNACLLLQEWLSTSGFSRGG